MAHRAVAQHFQTGVKIASTKGSEIAVETVGSFFGGKYGGMFIKYAFEGTGALKAINGVVSSAGNKLLSNGVPSIVTNKLAEHSIIRMSVANYATFGAYTLAGVASIPLNLFLGWVFDNSEEIMRNGYYSFTPQSTIEELMEGWEIIDTDEAPLCFEIKDKITVLNPDLELEAGKGIVFSWTTLIKQDNKNTFAIQTCVLYKSGYRVVIFDLNDDGQFGEHLFPLISCETLDDAEHTIECMEYVLACLGMDHRMFLEELKIEKKEFLLKFIDKM